MVIAAIKNCDASFLKNDKWVSQQAFKAIAQVIEIILNPVILIHDATSNLHKIFPFFMSKPRVYYHWP